MDPEFYLDTLEPALQRAGDPAIAIQAKNYVKGKYEFFGIKAPERRAIFKEIIRNAGLPEQEVFSSLIRELWNKPQREFQYFGMEVSEKMLRKSTKDFIEDIEFMLTPKSWWDTIDFLASKTLGKYFRKYPGRIQPITDLWLKGDDIWLKRSCLLFQKDYKHNTDVELLQKVILACKDSRNFFLRKGIGWALREYSKSDPEWVLRFVKDHDLPKLSEKEVLKRIKKAIDLKRNRGVLCIRPSGF